LLISMGWSGPGILISRDIGFLLRYGTEWRPRGADGLDLAAVDNVIGANNVSGDVGERGRVQDCDCLGFGDAPAGDVEGVW
jgi:hypothetical protein